MTRWLGLACLSLVLACSSDDKTKQPEKAEQAEQAEPVEMRAARSDVAVTFMTAKGAQGADLVDWESSIIANALVSVRTGAQMEMPPDAVDRMFATLDKVDVESAARARRNLHAGRWDGDKDCKATEKQGKAFERPPAEMLARLPKGMGDLIPKLESAKAFEVTCKDHHAVVLVGGSGKIVALEGPSGNDALDFDDIDPENRFVGYMNEPDEVPEEEAP